MADGDDRKLFVGALPQEAKNSDIKEYFESYGEIDTINLKMDPMTGRSRGFAFVVFKSIEGIQAALQQNAHVVKVNSLRSVECRHVIYLLCRERK